MGKNNQRYDNEYVKKVLKERGCILLSEYVNANTPLTYICHCGHENTITFYKFRQQKKGCRYCTKIGGYTHEEVEEYFKQQGCELLEQYKGVKEKVKYRCSCGKEDYITFDNFKQGRRCKECGLKKLSEKFKHSLNYVKEYFVKHNCIPLFDEYINETIHLKYQCECGNIAYIRFIDFKNNRRCNKCCSERRNKTKYQQGNIPVSSQQIYINELIGGELNYPVVSSCLDIAFPNEKIYVEYDGSGHSLSIKLKTISEEQFKEKEKRRRYALYKRGWKEIRIINQKDNLPSEEKIKEIIDYGKQILQQHSWVVFDIDKSQIKYRNYIGEYNFGKLKRFRRDYVS